MDIETTTFRVHVRVGSNGATLSLTGSEIAAGTNFEDLWEEDEDVGFRDHVIEVTAPLPPEVDVRVTLAAPVAPVLASDVT